MGLLRDARRRPKSVGDMLRLDCTFLGRFGRPARGKVFVAVSVFFCVLFFVTVIFVNGSF